MAAGTAAKVLRAPGRIVINPIDLSAAFPYGGTEVGKARQCAWTPLGVPFRIESEALGEATDVLEPNKRYLFNCFLRGWDDDAVEKLQAGNFEPGFVTQHAVYHEPGNKAPGESALDRAVVLLYVTDDPIHVPSLIVYRGIPDLVEGTDLELARGSELGITLAVDCLRDANNNILRKGMLSDLQLT